MASTKPKFRPRKKRIPEAKAAAFEDKYGDGTNGSISSKGEVRPEAEAARSKPTRPKKTRATFYLTVELLEELKDAVVALRASPQRFTMAGVVEQAVRAELKRLVAEHNDDEPFPARQMEPYVGRPPG